MKGYGLGWHVLLALLIVCLGWNTVIHGSFLDGPQILGEVGEIQASEGTEGMQEAEVLFASDLLEANPALMEQLDSRPDSASLSMTCIEQNPELPTGCEAVAATMALQALGYPIDKVAFASDYLIYHDDDVSRGYVGDPFSENGAGIYPPGLAMSANGYLIEQGSQVRAYEATGIGFDTLLSFLSLNCPALIWVTMDYGEPWYEYEEESGHDGPWDHDGDGYRPHRMFEDFEGFEDEKHHDYEYMGRFYSWYLNEHCVALKGYDLKKNEVTICDPLNGEFDMDLDELKDVFNQVGGYGVVFY